MLYSKLFGKSVKSTPKTTSNISSKLLFRGGFVRESTAGRYFFLPLGWRVHEKIKAVIKEEIDAIGGQEMISPVLHPLELWQETNRDKSVGYELMTIKDQRGAEFALGGTAEEMFIDVVRRFTLSYNDLPFSIYQFSTKFRDELRARGGLLRVREFVMKDAYSFDRDGIKFKKTYQSYWSAYERIFKRLGLESKAVEADNGYIGGDYCHEFVVDSAAGESKYVICDKCNYAAHTEVAKFIRKKINNKQPLKPYKEIKIDWNIMTIPQMSSYFKLPPENFLKNVIYKTNTGKLVIAVVTGDLKVNETKLAQVLKVSSLSPADKDDIKKIGAYKGAIHSWGHKGVIYIGDLVLKDAKNLIGGYKTKTTDPINVNYGRDFATNTLADIADVKDGDACEKCKKGELKMKKGIEVGNIFQLGYYYSKKMKGAEFVDKDGCKRPYYMGCYGIGLGRTMAAMVEKHHDENGIIWPESVAPFQVHLIHLGDEAVKQKAEKVYDLLQEKGIEVFWDDREVSAGQKFVDADLIGIPYRLVVSVKTGDMIELKKRTEDKSEQKDVKNIIEVFQNAEKN